MGWADREHMVRPPSPPSCTPGQAGRRVLPSPAACPTHSTTRTVPLAATAPNTPPTPRCRSSPPPPPPPPPPHPRPLSLPSPLHTPAMRKGGRAAHHPPAFLYPRTRPQTRLPRNAVGRGVVVGGVGTEKGAGWGGGPASPAPHPSRPHTRRSPLSPRRGLLVGTHNNNKNQREGVECVAASCCPANHDAARRRAAMPYARPSPGEQLRQPIHRQRQGRRSPPLRSWPRGGWAERGRGGGAGSSRANDDHDDPSPPLVWKSLKG